MPLKVIFILSLLSVSACSIYKSGGRNTFEAKAPENLPSVSAQSCDNVSEFNLGLSTHLSSDFAELIQESENVQVWKKDLEDGSMKVTVVEKLESQYSVCHYAFSSNEEWIKVQSDFFINF